MGIPSNEESGWKKKGYLKKWEGVGLQCFKYIILTTTQYTIYIIEETT
jgi:hypothetical protein